MMIGRKGQAALVVILVVLVGLTVTVAVLSRSVTTVNMSTQEEERARAFSAAEAGVEDALRQDLSAIAGGGPFTVGDTGTSVSYNVLKLTNVTTSVDPGQVVTIDWSNSEASSATVGWDACAKLVAIELTTSGGVTHSVETTATTKVFTKGPTSSLLRMHIVGCQASVTLAGNGGALSFYDVTSTGTSGQSTPQVQSRVKVTRSQPAAIGLLDYAVFSGSGI